MQEHTESSKQEKEENKDKKKDDFSLSTPPETTALETVTLPLDEIEAETSKKKAKAQAENAQVFMDAYTEYFKKKGFDNDWYKKHPPQMDEDGNLTMEFKSSEDMAKFSFEQATNKQNFILIDMETNKVLAFSNGDGKLYNGNGTEYDPKQKGEFIKSDAEYSKDFKMEPAAKEEPEVESDLGNKW